MPWSIPRTTGLTPICQAIVVCILMDIGAGLPAATRPIEVLQPIQALAQARADYLNAVLAYNRAQFRLYRAIGQPPLLPPNAPQPVPVSGRPTTQPGDNVR